jgi:hypothetical protein
MSSGLSLRPCCRPRPKPEDLGWRTARSSTGSCMCGLPAAGGAIGPAHTAPIRPRGGGFRNSRRRGSGARSCKPFRTAELRNAVRTSPLSGPVTACLGRLPRVTSGRSQGVNSGLTWPRLGGCPNFFPKVSFRTGGIRWGRRRWRRLIPRGWRRKKGGRGRSRWA